MKNLITRWREINTDLTGLNLAQTEEILKEAKQVKVLLDIAIKNDFSILYSHDDSNDHQTYFRLNNRNKNLEIDHSYSIDLTTTEDIKEFIASAIKEIENLKNFLELDLDLTNKERELLNSLK